MNTPLLRVEALRYRAIVDLDGTLTDFTHRLPLARFAEQGGASPEETVRRWDAFHAQCEADTPILPMIALLRTMADAGWEINIMTGRHHAYGAATFRWLARHNVPYHSLAMRREGDLRTTMEMKLAWASLYPFITLVFDDHARHSAAWRRAGYLCLQTSTGEY